MTDNPWGDRPEVRALIAAADEWWSAWACHERWKAWCMDERPDAEAVFSEEFADGKLDEDTIHEYLRETEHNLIESIRTATRSPADVALLRSVGAL